MLEHCMLCHKGGSLTSTLPSLESQTLAYEKSLSAAAALRLQPYLDIAYRISSVVP